MDTRAQKQRNWTNSAYFEIYADFLLYFDIVQFLRIGYNLPQVWFSTRYGAPLQIGRSRQE